MNELLKRIEKLSSAYKKESEEYQILIDVKSVLTELNGKVKALSLERSSAYHHGGWINPEDALPHRFEEIDLICSEVAQDKTDVFNWVTEGRYLTVAEDGHVFTEVLQDGFYVLNEDMEWVLEPHVVGWLPKPQVIS